MRKDDQKSQGGKANNGFIPTSFRAFSSYLRIVSSGASTVASTVRSAASAASAIVERENDAIHDQVHWAGFDKLEFEGNVTRQILLLGFRFGFQVWDVEEANNVHDLVSRYDGPVSFLQVLPKPLSSKRAEDKFLDSRPLLAVCADASLSGGGNFHDGVAAPYTGKNQNGNDQLIGGFVPTVVGIYSLKSQSFVHVLKFRSVVYSVRCSARVIAVLQGAQVHCFDAVTLEREYTFLTNPIAPCYSGLGSIGSGPLAVGPRWLAYSGSPVVVSNSGRVSPQHLAKSASANGLTSNGSVVVHYAKESSKQLAAGIVTLGDMGYKKLSRYYSELLPDGNSSQQTVSLGGKERGTSNGYLPDADSIGMVIVRDVVSRSVITQFKAHKSPISSLCFDPSGTILVTASVQGHNINVFQVMRGVSGKSSGPDSGPSYVHLYRLQRGLTNAVIQDISFSFDSHWIMISSLRGTSHLFALSPSESSVNNQLIDSCFSATDVGFKGRPKPPITLSAVGRIRSGNNGWRSTVTGAAVAATGRTSSFPGAVASTFHNTKGNELFSNQGSSNANSYILVFSPGCVVQYALRLSSGLDSLQSLSGIDTSYEASPEFESRFVIEAIKKWNVCQKQNRREREDNADIYGENGYSDIRKVFPERMKSSNCFEGGNKIMREKNDPEERHHVYISEAELHMHQSRIPLWARPEIYFQLMMKGDIKMDEGDDSGGEFEIERIAAYTIEARSKDIIPAVDSFGTPKFQMERVAALNWNNNMPVLHQRTGSSENGRFPSRSSFGAVRSLKDGIVNVAAEKTGNDGLLMRIEDIKGYVNNHEGPMSNTLLETVNNRENSGHSDFVNNSVEGLGMENLFEDEGEEFD